MGVNLRIKTYIVKIVSFWSITILYRFNSSFTYAINTALDKVLGDLTSGSGSISNKWIWMSSLTALGTMKGH